MRSSRTIKGNLIVSQDFYLQKVAMPHHTRSVECIHSNSKSNNQVIIINNEITIPIQISPKSKAVVDHQIDLEALW